MEKGRRTRVPVPGSPDRGSSHGEEAAGRFLTNTHSSLYFHFVDRIHLNEMKVCGAHEEQVSLFPLKSTFLSQ